MAANQSRAFDDLRSTVSDYGRLLRHRWKLGLIAFCVVGVGAFWASHYLPREYRAKTLFERRDDVVLRNLIHSNSPYSFDHIKSTLVQDMTGSRAMAEAAVDIGLLPQGALQSENALTRDELTALDEVIREYALQADVELVHSSQSLDTIELSGQSNDAEITSQFVVALRDRYIRTTRARINDILTGTRDFFRSELARFQAQVTNSSHILQEQFAEFPGVDPTNPASAGTRLETLRMERDRLLQHKVDIEAEIAAREKFLNSSSFGADGSVEREAANPDAPPVLPLTETYIRGEIERVEQEIANAMTIRGMTEEHPTVKGLHRKLEALFAAASSVTQSALNSGGAARSGARGEELRTNPVWAAHRLRIELELDALRSQLSAADQRFDKADQRVTIVGGLFDRLLRSSDKIQQLQEKLDEDTTTTAIWREHLGQLERILAAENDQRGTQFTIVEAPKDAATPIKPKMIGVFIVCLGCGLAAAALLVALAELLDRSFRSAAQVTRSIGLPVIECVGVIPTPKEKRKRFVRRLIWVPTITLLVAGLMLSASFAYASLAHPRAYRHAIAALDRTLESVGVPSPFIAPDSSSEG